MHSIVLPLIPGNKKLNIPSQYRISILLHAARSRYWVWSPGIVQLFYWTGVSATKRSLLSIHIHTHEPPVNHSLTSNWIDTHTQGPHFAFHSRTKWLLLGIIVSSVFRDVSDACTSVNLKCGMGPANQPISSIHTVSSAHLKLLCGSHHFNVSRVCFLIYTT